MARLLAMLPQLIMAVMLLLVGWSLARDFLPQLSPASARLAAPTLGRTIVFALVCAVGQVILGLAAALCLLWLARSKWTQRLLITLFLMPYAIPSSLVALIFRFALGPQSGWAERASRWWAIPGEYWLEQHPLRAAAAASIWQFFPFAFLLCFLALKAMPRETIRSAQLDGLGFGPLLFRVVLVEIAPVLASVFALRLVFMLVKFDTPYVFTETIASEQDVATISLWRALRGSGSPELSLIAIALQLMVLGLALLYMRFRTPSRA